MKVERQNPIHQGSSRFHSVNAKASSFRLSNMVDGVFHIGYNANLHHSQKLPRDFDRVEAYHQTAIARDINNVKKRRG